MQRVKAAMANPETNVLDPEEFVGRRAGMTTVFAGVEKEKNASNRQSPEGEKRTLGVAASATRWAERSTRSGNGFTRIGGGFDFFQERKRSWKR
jgi:hypothetical protein